jgi:UDP-glucose 4-epimerase
MKTLQTWSPGIILTFIMPPASVEVVDLECKQNNCRVYNLGNTHPHRVSELVRILEKHFNKTAKIRFEPLTRSGDVLATYANISKARRVSNCCFITVSPMRY